MEFIEPSVDDVERVVEDLWLPLAEEMAALDDHNELADGIREDAIEYRRQRLAADSTFLRVAVVDGEWVGYVQATLQESPPVFARGDSLHVDELWVTPAHRGAGIASELLDWAESWGREQGAERAGLNVNVDNESARALYDARGYDARRLYLDKSL